VTVLRPAVDHAGREASDRTKGLPKSSACGRFGRAHLGASAHRKPEPANHPHTDDFQGAIGPGGPVRQGGLEIIRMRTIFAASSAGLVLVRQGGLEIIRMRTIFGAPSGAVLVRRAGLENRLVRLG
jgi:hypothetical protein